MEKSFRDWFKARVGREESEISKTMVSIGIELGIRVDCGISEYVDFRGIFAVCNISEGNFGVNALDKR